MIEDKINWYKKVILAKRISIFGDLTHLGVLVYLIAIGEWKIAIALFVWEFGSRMVAIKPDQIKL